MYCKLYLFEARSKDCVDTKPVAKSERKLRIKNYSPSLTVIFGFFSYKFKKIDAG